MDKPVFLSKKQREELKKQEENMLQSQELVKKEQLNQKRNFMLNQIKPRERSRSREKESSNLLISTKEIELIRQQHIGHH